MRVGFINSMTVPSWPWKRIKEFSKNKESFLSDGSKLSEIKVDHAKDIRFCCVNRNDTECDL